jgi:NADH:ubiquinone oxidoreductase subunit D
MTDFTKEQAEKELKGYMVCSVGIDHDLRKCKLWKSENTVEYKVIENMPSE